MWAKNILAVMTGQVGDETMSVLEIWGAEYQENDCLLISPENRGLLEAICDRERCLMQVRGCIISNAGSFSHALEGWKGCWLMECRMQDHRSGGLQS